MPDIVGEISGKNVLGHVLVLGQCLETTSGSNSTVYCKAVISQLGCFLFHVCGNGRRDIVIDVLGLIRSKSHIHVFNWTDANYIRGP